jgi:hypothetical protein
VCDPFVMTLFCVVGADALDMFSANFELPKKEWVDAGTVSEYLGCVAVMHNAQYMTHTVHDPHST